MKRAKKKSTKKPLPFVRYKPYISKRSVEIGEIFGKSVTVSRVHNYTYPNGSLVFAGDSDDPLGYKEGEVRIGKDNVNLFPYINLYGTSSYNMSVDGMFQSAINIEIAKNSKTLNLTIGWEVSDSFYRFIKADEETKIYVNNIISGFKKVNSCMETPHEFYSANITDIEESVFSAFSEIVKYINKYCLTY